jgi:hypothetical protein
MMPPCAQPITQQEQEPSPAAACGGLSDALHMLLCAGMCVGRGMLAGMPGCGWVESPHGL